MCDICITVHDYFLGLYWIAEYDKISDSGWFDQTFIFKHFSLYELYELLFLVAF